MGIFSSDETVTTKTTVNTGDIHNNIALSEDTGTTIKVLLIVITILKLLEFAMIIYSSFIRRIKKKYNGANPNLDISGLGR